MNNRLILAVTTAVAFAAAPALAQVPSVTGAAKSATGALAPPPAATSALPGSASVGATAKGTLPDASVNPPSTPATTSPSSGDTTGSVAGAASASTSGADVSVTTGMAVKDNAGATIGSVTDVKTGADGKKTATIKMGADTFAVDTTSLAVANGSATVNATQAEIKGMLGKAKK